MYREREYRRYFKGEKLVFFQVEVEETDLMIGADRYLQNEAKEAISKYRNQIKSYIRKHPGFAESLEPVRPGSDAPDIIVGMCNAAETVHVGPMAAVAGAVSEMTGKHLLNYSKEIIVENGGDIFLKSDIVRKAGVFTGNSPLNEKVAIEIKPEMTPIGICTSSGTVGHSLSFGKADAVVILSKDTSLADAAATAVCNRIKSYGELEKAVKFASGISGIEGVLAIIGDRMAADGNIKLVPF